MQTGRPHPKVAILLAFLAAAGARAAGAVTALESVSVSTDVTVELGTNAQLTSDHDVAIDDLAGNVVLAPLGTPPASSDVTGYEPLPNGDSLLCFDTTVELPGPVLVRPGDVARHGGTYSIELAAAANGVPAGVHCDAVARDGAGKLVLSFDVTAALPGGVIAHDEDLVRLDAPGTWSVFFDGSAAGIPTALDVDGAHRLQNGNLGLSFDGGGQLGGVDFGDEDVLEYEAAGPTWVLAYDGSAANSDLAAADVDALPEPSLLPLLAAATAGLAALGRARIRA